MSVRRVTRLAILTTVVALAVWDVIPALTEARGDTISEFIADRSAAHPTIPLGAGVLMGHFFWPGVPIPFRRTLALLLGPFAVVATIDAFSLIPAAPLTASLAGGFLLGHFFWAQAGQGIVK